jgi:hypothetical protein
MTGFGAPVITVLALLLLGAALFGAVQYGRNRNPSPVSTIELSQPLDQTSPKWIAVTDPDQKTVSIIMVQIGDANATATLASVTSYSETAK